MKSTNTNNKKVIFYIDGFNFQYGLKNKNWEKYYWLDLVSFCEKFLHRQEQQEITEVCYFTAIPFARNKQEDLELFLAANKRNSKFSIHLGKFLINKGANYDNQIPTKEKQTDMNIAMKMVEDAFIAKCDISILVSADCDLVPPIEMIKKYKPYHKIFAYFPPSHFSYELKMKANNTTFLENHEMEFKKSLFKDVIRLSGNGKIRRPERWG